MLLEQTFQQICCSTSTFYFPSEGGSWTIRLHIFNFGFFFSSFFAIFVKNVIYMLICSVIPIKWLYPGVEETKWECFTVFYCNKRSYLKGIHLSSKRWKGSEPCHASMCGRWTRRETKILCLYKLPLFFLLVLISV